MARVAGVNLPAGKRIDVALTYIYGIGQTTSKQILESTRVKPELRVEDLDPKDEKKLNDYIAKNLQVEGALKQVVFRNIKRLKDIKCYRGLRHRAGLPVRGQNTRKNARTRKGKSIAVGGLKRKLDKK